MPKSYSSLNNIDLDELYEPPSEPIQKAVTHELMSFHIEYLDQATFFCLASGRKQGLDASPRGGSPGFVHVLDNHTIAFADWPGNNRIESMRNLVDDNRVGMLFLFPGLSVFMRINGKAKVSCDEALLTTLAEGSKIPKTAIVITIDEVLFHCGKALNRAKLWEAEARIDKSLLPTPGKIFAALNGLDSKSSNLIDQKYEHSVKNELYG